MEIQKIKTKGSWLKNINVTEAISALFILLFVYTALSKLMGVKTFEDVLQTSPLIGRFSSLIAWGLPSIELVIAFLLLRPGSRLIGFYSTMIMMILFTLYVAYMLAFASELPCYCGGVIQQLNWTQHLLLNILLTLLSIIAVLIERRKVYMSQ